MIKTLPTCIALTIAATVLPAVMPAPTPEIAVNEDCVTGPNQCKARLFIVTLPNPCGATIEARITGTGSVQTPGSCQCNGAICQNNNACEFKGTLQIRTTSPSRHVKSAIACGDTNTWVTIGGINLDSNPLQITCDGFGSTFLASAWDGACGGGGLKKCDISVTPECTPCNGDC